MGKKAAPKADDEGDASSSSEPLQAQPQAYNILNAGTVRANGVYHLDTTQAADNAAGSGSAVYRGSGTAEGLWMYELKDAWYIGVAADADDWYTAKSDGGPRPPAQGWQVGEDGAEAPPPMVVPVSVSSGAL